MNSEQAKSLIRGHEGLRLKAYRDSRGVLTIGYGCNLETNAARSLFSFIGLNYVGLCAGSLELSQEQADELFDRQFAIVVASGKLNFPEFDQYPDNVAAVICDMIFNLGWGGFQEFRKFAKAIKARDWTAAIVEMLDSQWAEQVSNRVADDVRLMKEVRGK